jgi:hypothetical protein
LATNSSTFNFIAFVLLQISFLFIKSSPFLSFRFKILFGS